MKLLSILVGVLSFSRGSSATSGRAGKADNDFLAEMVVVSWWSTWGGDEAIEDEDRVRTEKVVEMGDESETVE